MPTLQGKVAVVTGAGSGIGRAVAVALAAKGATVAVADIDPVSAKTVAEQVGGTAHQVDVSSEPELTALRDAVLGAHGQTDTLVNNAGITGAPCNFADTPLDNVRRILDINLMGTINGTAVFLPELMRRAEASLGNISSYTALLGMPTMVAYSTSKFGVRGFTESLRMELGGSPVAVTLVLPGATRTSLMTNSPLVADERRAALQQAFDDTPAVGPEVVAAGVLKGIRSGRPRVRVGKDTRALDVVVRTLPGRYSSLLAKPMNKVIKKAFG